MVGNRYACSLKVLRNRHLVAHPRRAQRRSDDQHPRIFRKISRSASVGNGPAGSAAALFCRFRAGCFFPFRVFDLGHDGGRVSRRDWFAVLCRWLWQGRLRQFSEQFPIRRGKFGAGRWRQKHEAQGSDVQATRRPQPVQYLVAPNPGNGFRPHQTIHRPGIEPFLPQESLNRRSRLLRLVQRLHCPSPL